MKDIDYELMKETVEKTSPLYMCNRPPGPAGAMIVTKDHRGTVTKILGGVHPTTGLPTCKEVGCNIVDGHCIRNVHAERNAIFTAARIGVPLSDATIYSILKPCYECSVAIIQAGIIRIFYAAFAYNEVRTQIALDAAGVECVYIDIDLPYGRKP